MNKITQSDIDSLAKVKELAVLSMYIPTHRMSTPATIQEDQARYRNLIRDGLDRWEAVVGPDNVKAIRSELEGYTEDANFWADTGKTLAIFAAENSVTIFHLPIESDELVNIGNCFDLAPLRVIMSQDQPFYLLALAKHDPKLFYGDIYGLQAVDLELPASPEDALNIDEMFSGSNTIRGQATPGGGNDTFSTHGQGDTNHAGQEEHLKYLRIIDNKILKSKDINQTIPLLIAATESEASDFKRVSSNPRLIEEFVQGNHTLTPTQQLHELVWSIITKELIQPKINRLIERFHEDKGRQKASSDLVEIAEAITNGKVESLMIGMLEITNDSVSDDAHSASPMLRFQNEYTTSSMCELSQAVANQGGEVIGVDRLMLDTPTKVAALYRY